MYCSYISSVSTPGQERCKDWQLKRLWVCPVHRLWDANQSDRSETHDRWTMVWLQTSQLKGLLGWGWTINCKIVKLTIYHLFYFIQFTSEISKSKVKCVTAYYYEWRIVLTFFAWSRSLKLFFYWQKKKKLKFMSQMLLWSWITVSEWIRNITETSCRLSHLLLCLFVPSGVSWWAHAEP